MSLFCSLLTLQRDILVLDEARERHGLRRALRGQAARGGG